MFQLIAGLTLAFATATVVHAAEPVPLPALGADATQTSVSGISSGAYMAGQYQFAHSSSVIGAAIIAGGPYGCAEAMYGSFLPAPARLAMNASQSINGCMLATLQWYGIPDAAGLAERARSLAADARIDPIANLKSHRVYLFSGGSDAIVAHDVVVAAAEVYLRVGVPKIQIKTGPNLPAGHGFVAEPKSADCERSAKPFIVNCGYDQAGDLLAHIYGPLLPKSAISAGTLSEFDQRPFTKDESTAGLADTGSVYVPNACRETPGCRIHIAFHGCQQNRNASGDAFVVGTGFAAWADTNRLIILFPEARADALVNPLGCWDWWGYTGFDYLTRAAPQIAAVNRMAEHLAKRSQL